MIGNVSLWARHERVGVSHMRKVSHVRDRYRFLGLLAAGVLVALVLMPSVGAARPEFAARQNESCLKCHYTPMGGGMRNDRGVMAEQKLSLKATKEALEDYKDYTEFDPALNETIRLGADLRVMWHDIAKDESQPSEDAASTFYTMQAMGYVNARLLPVLQFTGGYDVAQNLMEGWGMIDNLPAGLYLRAGRFILPYGLRMDDHTLFTRSAIGFGVASQDSGVEVGIAPGPFFLTAALTNGNLGEQAMDRDGDYYAVTGQTGVRFWKMGLGFSGFHNVRDGFTRDIYGPWFTLGVWRLAFLGEFDFVAQEVDNVADPTKEDKIASAASFIEAEAKIIDGLYAVARYSHFDPDLEVDENFVDQTMGGITFYPVPYVHTMLQFRQNREADPLKINNDEIMIQGHVFF